MEPTGIYWQRIASYIIASMDNCEAVFVKQQKVKLTRQLYGNGKGKNDPLDALAIARCLKDKNFFNMNVHDEKFRNLKELTRFRKDYLKRQSQLINKLDNDVINVFPGYKNAAANWSSKSLITIFSEYPLPEDIVAADEKDIFAQLRTNVKSGIGYKFIRLLKEVAAQFISNDTGNLFAAEDDVVRFIMKKRFKELLQVQKEILELKEIIEKKVSEISYAENMIEIKGIGEGTIAALLGETGDLAKYETGKHLISFIGFDLKECSSGEHKGKMKISKCGSRDVYKRQSVHLAKTKPVVIPTDFINIINLFNLHLVLFYLKTLKMNLLLYTKLNLATLLMFFLLSRLHLFHLLLLIHYEVKI